MKYYVTSGSIEAIVTAKAPISAAILTYNKNLNRVAEFAEHMRVSEKGHAMHADDVIIATDYAKNDGEEFFRKLDELG